MYLYVINDNMFHKQNLKFNCKSKCL